MSQSRLASAVVVLLSAVATVHGQPAPVQSPSSPGTRHIYISVVDRNGAPIAGLTEKDVTVREDSGTRDVIAVQAATAPLQIALLVDDTGPGIRFIREGVGAFIQRLGGQAEIALFSTGGRNSMLVDFTGQVDALYQGVRRLSTRTTTGAYLLDGVRDAIRLLNEREAARPVVVVLTLEGPEFSNLRADRLLGELHRSRAALHVVTLGKPTLKTMTGWNEPPTQSLRENLDENINRKKFLEDGSRQSGGRFEQILVDSGIPAAMKELADELGSQYVVVYSRPEGHVPRKVAVSVKRAGARVRFRSDLTSVNDSK